MESDKYLIQAKTFAQRLDISLSMLYQLKKTDKRFPVPEYKLFKESKRGWRWTEEQVQRYQEQQRVRVEATDDPAPAFVPVNPHMFLIKTKMAV